MERQLTDCQALARRLGWTVSTAPYDDNDLSAMTGKTRPGFEKVVDAIKHGEINAVICGSPTGSTGGSPTFRGYWTFPTFRFAPSTVGTWTCPTPRAGCWPAAARERTQSPTPARYVAGAASGRAKAM